ncbi:unnamed protein product [Callosobruchus maculatus]|uniref:Uncharacterized protein n=1 Tax=Callosobruchus maculatus TaxID=64391 RepID=A0A653DLH1_CALMS|nr:unnamed protein product [Callosobruchus maculatus]
MNFCFNIWDDILILYRNSYSNYIKKLAQENSGSAQFPKAAMSQPCSLFASIPSERRYVVAEIRAPEWYSHPETYSQKAHRTRGHAAILLRQSRRTTAKDTFKNTTVPEPKGSSFLVPNPSMLVVD